MAEWQLIPPPKTWRQLQENVKLILSDCGYSAEIEKEVALGRGKAVADVYALKELGLPITILCECKHWKKNVPKGVVQGFRAIVLESGASLGYIISTKGFQSGSYEVVAKTNIQLLSWTEFEASFRMEWLRHWVDKVSRAGKELRAFVDYVILLSLRKDPTGAFIEGKWREMEILRTGHENWLFMSMVDHYTHINTAELSWDETLTTIEKRAPRYITLKVEYLRNYFQEIYEKCREELNKIEALYEGKVKWNSETILPY